MKLTVKKDAPTLNLPIGENKSLMTFKPGDTFEVTEAQRAHFMGMFGDRVLEDAGDSAKVDPAVQTQADKDATAWAKKVQGMKKAELVKLATERKMPGADKAKTEELTLFLTSPQA